MTPSKEDLQEYAKETRKVADEMLKLSVVLGDATEDKISPTDCNISGGYADASFAWEILPMIERV